MAAEVAGMTEVELHHGAATDVGRVREVNEDAFLVAPPVFVVADGMGGHEHGDVASRIVVEEFARLVEAGFSASAAEPAVEATLDACQRRLVEYAEQQPPTQAGRSPGTTVVAALLAEDDGRPVWLLVNLGDSRIYRVHDGLVEQVSVDHSVVQQLIDDGSITAEEAEHHPERHVITRALGGPARGDADYVVLPLTEVDRLLLCSDGVSGLVAPAELADILVRHDDPRDAAEQAVAAALDAGGDDNATAVVVDVVGLSHATSYDSEQQRMSLEQKLGALP